MRNDDAKESFAPEIAPFVNECRGTQSLCVGLAKLQVNWNSNSLLVVQLIHGEIYTVWG